ncbi:MAG: hypothetical protein R3C46_07520 [Hyphomonadaceae bacterium]
MRDDLGRFTEDGLSWSQQLAQSLFMWNIIEGTHVLTIMFFAGTIWLIDLRMMGVAFRNVPLSKLNEKVLPITMASFGVMILTGVVSYIGRDPVMYYHNLWFRLKMVFLLAAVINIAWFHFKVQKTLPEWDTIPEGETPKRSGPAMIAFLASCVALLATFPFMTGMDLALTVTTRIVLVLVAGASLFVYLNGRTPSIPTAVKLSGMISLTSWMLIIIFGRFIAYDWFYCEKTEPGSFSYAIQECASYMGHDETGEEYMDEEPSMDETEMPPDTPPDGEEAPAEPDADTTQPTGQEG